MASASTPISNNVSHVSCPCKITVHARLLLQIISRTILCHSPSHDVLTPYCFWREHSGVKIKSVSVCVSVPIEFLCMSVSGQNETLLLKLYPAKINTNPQNLSCQNCPHVLNSPTISGCKTPTITFLSCQNCPHVLNSPTITGCKTPTITSRQRHHTNVSAVDDYVSNNQFPSITFSNNQYPSITWQGQKNYPENGNQGNSMSKQQMTQVRATANLQW